jgi:hypothetical protein
LYDFTRRRIVAIHIEVMKTRIRRFALGAFVFGALSFTAFEAHARLPKPNVTKAIILTVDMDTQSLVIKTAEQERPLVLHWNEETQFLKGRRQIVPASLKRGDIVEIHYKRISFRNPLLKKVIVLPPVQIRSESGRSNE